MGDFLAELKRRHIYRVAAAYAFVAWMLLQLVNNLAPALNLPNWALTLVVVLLGVGFPIALIFAWIAQLSSSEGAKAATGTLDWALMAALVVVIALVSYEQLVPRQAAVPAQQASALPAQPGGNSVAVLPFGNLSGDAGQEFFSDGMTEEITSALAKVPDLQVVARASAFQFKGQQKDMRQVGQALGARYLIDGSVRKAGNRVRITAQLIRADSGVNVWSDSYDRELTDIFAAQEDIAQAIAGALKVPLGLAQGDTLVRDRTKDLATYDQYLRAKALFRARGPGIAQAIAILEQVTARDPGFAPGWSLLANAYLSLPFTRPEGRTGSPDIRRGLQQTALGNAEKAAREAIRLDSRNAAGYAALGYAQAQIGKWASADDFFKQALALDPNEPVVLGDYITALRTEGRLKQSLELAEKLRALEPVERQNDWAVAQALLFSGQNEAAIQILETLPVDFGNGLNHNASLALAYAAKGQFAKAADRLLAMHTNLVSRQSIETAAQILREAPDKVTAPDSIPLFDATSLTFVYIYAGVPERVLDFFDSWYELQVGYINYVQGFWPPIYAPLRKTDRFKAFMRKVGLVDYWKARGWPDLCRPMGVDDFVCD